MRTLRTGTAVLASVLFASIAAAQQPKSVDTASTRSAAAPLPLPLMQFKVLLQVDYVAGEPLPQPPNQGFGIRRTRFFAQVNPLKGLGFRLQFEPGALANGPLSAPPLRGAPLFEAYLDYALAPSVLIRAGQQRVPFGLNSYQAPPSSPMIEFPQFTRYVIQRVAAFRDMGVTAGGRTGALEYAAGIFNGAGMNATADNDSTRDFAARVVYAVRPGVQVAASGWRGHSGNLFTRSAGASPIKSWYDNADFRRFAAELRVATGSVDVLAEYGSERLASNPNAQNPTPNQQALRRSGYNVAGALRLGMLSPRLQHLQVAARYDRWDPNHDIANDCVTEYALGVNLYLLSRTQAPDKRFGRVLNDVQRDSRIMVFWELARPQTNGTAPSTGVPLVHDSQRLHVRWELFY